MIKVNDVIVDEDNKKKFPKCTGTLDNLKKYARVAFGSDEDQQHAFISITAAFILRLHEEANKEEMRVPPAKKRKIIGASHVNFYFLKADVFLVPNAMIIIRVAIHKKSNLFFSTVSLLFFTLP